MKLIDTQASRLASVTAACAEWRKETHWISSPRTMSSVSFVNWVSQCGQCRSDKTSRFHNRNKCDVVGKPLILWLKFTFTRITFIYSIRSICNLPALWLTGLRWSRANEETLSTKRVGGVVTGHPISFQIIGSVKQRFQGSIECCQYLKVSRYRRWKAWILAVCGGGVCRLRQEAAVVDIY